MFKSDLLNLLSASSIWKQTGSAHTPLKPFLASFRVTDFAIVLMIIHGPDSTFKQTV